MPAAAMAMTFFTDAAELVSGMSFEVYGRNQRVWKASCTARVTRSQRPATVTAVGICCTTSFAKDGPPR
jgi:hypothetical protein